MRYLLILFFSMSLLGSNFAQKGTLNQGRTSQKDYFSVIKFENFYGFIIVMVKIKGDEYRFLLDTGAPNSISKALQNKLKLQEVSKIPVGDSNGVTDSLTVLAIDELELGGITFTNTPALLVDSPFFIDCMKVDGFIGSNMLRNSIVKFSCEDSTITITDNIAKLNLSKKNASKLELDPFQSSPLIKINIEGKKQGRQLLLFDTGKRGVYELGDKNYETLKKFAIFDVEAAGSGRSAIGLYGTGKDVMNYKLRLPKLIINGAIFQNISLTTSSGGSKIGHDILKYGNATVDYKNKKFYFEPFKDTINLAEKTFPISPRIDDNQLFVGIIWDEKLKEDISIGDQIIAINDINYEHIDMCDAVLKMGLYKKNDTAIFIIRNAKGIVKKLTLERK
jgi:hypothetical protein